MKNETCIKWISWDVSLATLSQEKKCLWGRSHWMISDSCDEKESMVWKKSFMKILGKN